MDKAVPKIEIELDKPRMISFPWGALKAFEKETGESIFTALQKPSFTNMTELLWAGLIHEDRTLTVKRVEEILFNAPAGDVMEKLMEAITSAMPAGAADPLETEAS